MAGENGKILDKMVQGGENKGKFWGWGFGWGKWWKCSVNWWKNGGSLGKPEHNEVMGHYKGGVDMVEGAYLQVEMDLRKARSHLELGNIRMV